MYFSFKYHRSHQHKLLLMIPSSQTFATPPPPTASLSPTTPTKLFQLPSSVMRRQVACSACAQSGKQTPSKYKCPACEVGSCSLLCVKHHKTTTVCPLHFSSFLSHHSTEHGVTIPKIKGGIRFN